MTHPLVQQSEQSREVQTLSGQSTQIKKEKFYQVAPFPNLTQIYKERRKETIREKPDWNR